MRIITRVSYRMLPGGGLTLISEEGYDYEGPLALCDRGQSTAATKQAGQYSAADQAQADTTFAMGNSAIGAVNDEGYQKWLRDSQEFAPGGGFAQTMAGDEAAATAGGKGSTDDYMRDYAAKSGIGPTTSQMVASSEEAGRQNQRDEAAAARDAEMKRLAGLDSANKDWINTKQQVAGDIGGYYAPALSASTGQLSNETNAAKTPGFWDTFGHDIAAAGGAVATGVCWIAAELWGGWLDPRTILVREWLNGCYRNTVIGKLVVGLYARIGKRAAGMIRRVPFLRYVFLPLFNWALHKARKAKG